MPALITNSKNREGASNELVDNDEMGKIREGRDGEAHGGRRSSLQELEMKATASYI